MDICPVCLDNQQIGTLRLRREGNWVHSELRCKGREQGIYRAFLLCKRGEIPLGVVEPAGEELSLCRRIPAREIESRGGAVRVEVRLSYAFAESWQPVNGGFFQKHLLWEEPCEGAMWRRVESGRLLAIPYEPGRPFPLVSLFCFARIMPVSRRRCAVFCFDGEERPVMVEKEG